MRRRMAAASVAMLGVLLVACQPAGPSGTPSGAGSGTDASPSADALSTLGPPPSPTPPDETTPVILDPTLLDFLPESINGIDVTESLDEATQALSSPDLDKIASAMDAGVAVDTGSGDLVYAWVVRLRPDRFSEDIYRQWRDSYDEGACGGASDGGGVVGRAEATIDDRTVYITSCTQGLRTYHVWLKDEGILISASALGDGKFGEVLMDNLRVPS